MKWLFEFREGALVDTSIIEVNIIAVGALVGIGIALCTLVKNYHQTKKQTKVESANLILRLKEPWKNTKFKKFLRKLQTNDTEYISEIEIEEFLNQLEDIAIFYNDNTLTENHVKEFFGVNFKKINENTHVTKIYNKFRDLSPHYTYININRLLEKIDKWKI